VKPTRTLSRLRSIEGGARRFSVDVWRERFRRDRDEAHSAT